MITVFVSGRFNVLHPGHLRLFKFARSCGDQLIVGVESDSLAGSASFVSEQLRLEGVRSCSLVDEAFLMDQEVSEIVALIKPNFVVKGREHEVGDNPERSAIESYGGRLLFGSGEVEFTSSDLFRREFSGQRGGPSSLPLAFMSRHGIQLSRLLELLERFSELKILVVGDTIVDEYISCDPLGMSQEDPTLVVRPIESQRFLGGAGIVSAHAAAMGAHSCLVTVVGEDEEARFVEKSLADLKVRAGLVGDPTRPTTLKTRYRCQSKTLLRVNRLRQTAISTELQKELVNTAIKEGFYSQLIVFSDFNYGVLPRFVVEEISSHYRKLGAVQVADSQSSSQVGDVSRFLGMNLLTPTEREARIATKNAEDGLIVLAESLRSLANAQNVFVTLGAEGVLVCPGISNEQPWPPDQIEALNPMPKDVAGAGDSMLIASGMALAVGANIWEAACLGSIAAAIQVGRVGNTPISLAEMRAALTS